MTHRKVSLGLMPLLFAAALFAADKKKGAGRKKTPDYEPTSRYEVRRIEGWKVYVHKGLIEDPERRELGRKALRLLEVKLYDVTRVIPAGPLAELKKVAIWLETENPRKRGAQYHPSRAWLANHGYNPEKAKSVELSNAKDFLDWSRQQPYMVLHELAHAYHHRVLGHGNKEIQAAFKAAKESGKYEKILHHNGRRRVGYAMNSQMEYFAETTEAFFGTNDMFPFVRAELREHDPRMYAVLRKVWKVGKGPF